VAVDGVGEDSLVGGVDIEHNAAALPCERRAKTTSGNDRLAIANLRDS
jgi:hypothetical protein